MSDEKKYTERDLILAKRLAHAACEQFCTGRHSEACQQHAKQKYPFPKITVPHIEPDGLGWEWRLATLWEQGRGRLKCAIVGRQVGESDDDWRSATNYVPTEGRIRLWCKLLDLPATKEVDSDE